MARTTLIVSLVCLVLACTVEIADLAAPDQIDAGDANALEEGAPDADADDEPDVAASGDASDENDCPGRAGPKPVRVTLGATSFCIDSTEVSNEQYFEFLQDPDGGAAPAVCAALADRVPNGWTSGLGNEKRPVARVNWCQAYMYCRWAGKRLCGAIDGGLNIADDAHTSQWYFACSKGKDGVHIYPYGFDYDGGLCVGPQLPSPKNVGETPSCVGAFPGVYDLAGNVAEWEDACDDDTDAAPETRTCVYRGGGFGTMTSSVDFKCQTTHRGMRLSFNSERGIRCCSP